MYYIIYISEATELINENELKNILSSSRSNNQKNAVTGVLLFANNSFIQLLEGARQNVEETFNVIKSDRRHLNVTVIAWGPIPQRCFPEWYMGFNMIKTDAHPNMQGFLESTKKAIERKNCALPVKLLQSFVRNNKLEFD